MSTLITPHTKSGVGLSVALGVGVTLGVGVLVGEVVSVKVAVGSEGSVAVGSGVGVGSGAAQALSRNVAAISERANFCMQRLYEVGLYANVRKKLSRR
jgi:hypothetical protein